MSPASFFLPTAFFLFLSSVLLTSPTISIFLPLLLFVSTTMLLLFSCGLVLLALSTFFPLPLFSVLPLLLLSSLSSTLDVLLLSS